MGLVVEPSELVDLAPGSHVCWVVRDPAGYLECAATLLAQAGRTNEKPLVFGPACGDALEILRPLAAMAADPWEAFLGRGDLNPDAMFTMMEEQTARARDEGYRGIRLVADMDWLIPARPSVELLVGFELLLDRHVKRLGATIICAYRETSFDTEALAGSLSVHPVEVGVDSPPQFRLVADDLDRWRLVGEVDIAVEANFAGPRSPRPSARHVSSTPRRSPSSTWAGCAPWRKRSGHLMGQSASSGRRRLCGAVGRWRASRRWHQRSSWSADPSGRPVGRPARST